MKILLTGAGGFLGKILADIWKNSHETISLGRSKGNTVICDLASAIPLLSEVDMVVHAAGLAHRVPAGTEEESEFFKVNVKGTDNLLHALTNTSKLPGLFVFISSVAVYGIESGAGIDESSPLLAKDAYGKSKIEAEQLILAWGHKTGVPVIILRLPLIAGPNPPGNLGDMIKAIQAGYYFRIGAGSARRSVVNAADIARLILRLKHHSGIYNLTSGSHPTIREIDTLIAKQLSKKVKVMPVFMAQLLAKTGDLLPFFPFNSRRLSKLT